MLSWPTKDPDDILDYLVDWSARLPVGDAIATSTWLVPNGITQDSDSSDDTTATIWLSGGTIGEVYEITNRVVTDDGRQMDQTMKLKVAAK